MNGETHRDCPGSYAERWHTVNWKAGNVNQSSVTLYNRIGVHPVGAWVIGYASTLPNGSNGSPRRRVGDWIEGMREIEVYDVHPVHTGVIGGKVVLLAAQSRSHRTRVGDWLLAMGYTL